MSGPRTGDQVTLSVPQREQLRATVASTSSAGLDLTLLAAPRTALERLAQHQVFVQFVNADGVFRLRGLVVPRPGSMVMDGFGAGDTIRVQRRGEVQLLRRPDAVRAQVAARVTVVPIGQERFATDATTVDLGGAGMRVRGLSFARPGDLFSFDLHLSRREPAVSGQFRIDAFDREAVASVHFTVLSPPERSRLIHYAFEHTVQAA